MRNIYLPIILLCALTVFSAPGVYAATGPAPAGTLGSGTLPTCENAPSVSVGRTVAMGSTFVPVSDAAVTLNTGILVYKECVLRGIYEAQRQYETAKLVKESATNFLTGRQGGPMYPENLAEDRGKLSDTVVSQNVNGTLLNMIPSLYQDDVKRAITRTYSQQTRNPGASLACSGTAASLARIQTGGYNGPQDLFTIADPNCNPLFSFFNAQSLVMSDVAAQQADMLTRLGWNNGVYDVTTTGADGVPRVVTPGFVVANDLEQKLGSSFRQLENANDIGQMIDGYFTQIGNRIMSGGTGGLKGLINAQFGISFLDRIVANTGTTAQNTQVSAAADSVASAYANETAYLAAKTATAAIIQQKITQLRTTENTCWATIIPRVTAYAQTTGISQLVIATSTTASQTAITTNRLLELASSTATVISASNITVSYINQILLGIGNGTTTPATAYEQLNALVSGGVLHTFDQAQEAIKETQDVQSALTSVVSDTVKHWGDDPLSATDPLSGWCNINNPDVITMWTNKWKVNVYNPYIEV